ncbi:MAG TPA: ATP-binding protein [Puia sp.]|nr:ATP-binding protein [Puia sp.]
MRKLIILVASLFCLLCLHAQQNSEIIRNQKALSEARTEVEKFKYLRGLFYSYLWIKPDSSLIYAEHEISFANQIKSNYDLNRAYHDYAWFNIVSGDYPKAVFYINRAKSVAERSGNSFGLATTFGLLSIVYEDEGNFKEALVQSKMAKELIESQSPPSFKSEDLDTAISYMTITWRVATQFAELNEPDSSLYYMHVTESLMKKILGENSWSGLYYGYGNIYVNLREYAKAIQNYRKGIEIATTSNKDMMDNFSGLSTAFMKTGQLDSSIFYARAALALSRQTHYSLGQLSALNLLTSAYTAQNKTDSIAKYLALTVAAKDSLFSRQKIIQIQSMAFDQQLREQETVQQEKELKNKIAFYSALVTIAIFIVIGFLLYRNNRLKQKANIVLQNQKEEINIQKLKVEEMLNNLRATQSQLIQSEKMASLGELTAGIAHEIQNPLNFVNNFSEVSNELIQELLEERNNPKESRNEILENEILNDIKQNLEKINNHGRRADGIVKGMLQHSRSSAGVKEPTDINALADEYLRLSFHGLRAKDNSFNATMKTDFDNNIGKINVVPQDIGRVLLNLYNNAFYAVNDKMKTAGANYQPSVWVHTKKINDKVVLTVTDNGNGIPEKVIDKIFQPFFTTKPTGLGTGLGLSLSYDIIKAHGGELKVESKEGDHSEFVVQLFA